MSNTPGPWEVRITDGPCGDDFEIVMGEARTRSSYPSGQRFTVAEGEDREQWPEQYAEIEANARLIAAAPDLLAACKAALNDRMYKDWPEVADLLIAAIAKAELKGADDPAWHDGVCLICE